MTQMSDPIRRAAVTIETQAVAAPPNTATEPCGELSIRTLAMPADTNQNGDIFGGWLLSHPPISA
jgi:acyl-CoA hydrolase